MDDMSQREDLRTFLDEQIAKTTEDLRKLAQWAQQTRDDTSRLRGVVQGLQAAKEQLGAPVVLVDATRKRGPGRPRKVGAHKVAYAPDAAEAPADSGPADTRTLPLPLPEPMQ